jgi:Protein of unknown function VcgC/VcgE (DUF2780)
MKAFVTMAALATMAVCAPLAQGVAQTDGLGLLSTGTVVKQNPAVGLSGNIVGTAPVASQAPSLVDILVRQLGITPEQAAGGAGAIFSMAKQGMSPTDFSQVIKAVPGMNQYLAAAPSQTAPTYGMADLMGAAGSALGGSGSALGNMASLVASFQSLGLNFGMVSQFIPVILQYAQTQGGAATMSLLQSALAH